MLEAINNDKTINKIYVRKGHVDGSLKMIAAKARDKGVLVQEVDKSKMDELALTDNYQGIIAFCPPKEYVEVSEILAIAAEKGEKPFILILDEITDPHNFGAILRSAEAFGVHGVVIPKRRAVALTGVVAKTSAGAIEHVPVARVNSIVNVIDDLKKQGIWVTCSDSDGSDISDTNLSGALALVIGSEGKGVGHLIKEKSDFIVKIPMYGKLSSLNASVAAGILMYEAAVKRK